MADMATAQEKTQYGAQPLHEEEVSLFSIDMRAQFANA